MEKFRYFMTLTRDEKPEVIVHRVMFITTLQKQAYPIKRRKARK